MKMIDQPSVHVTRCPQHRNKKRSRHLSSTGTRSTNVIHTTIQSLDSTLHRNNNNFTRFHPNPSKNSVELIKNSTRLTKLNQNTWKTNSSTEASSQQDNYLPRNVNKQTKVRKRSSASGKAIQDEVITTTNAWSDQKGVTTDHHHDAKRKEKKKFSRLCICISVIVPILLAITLTTVLVVLLVKSKTTSATITLRWNPIAVTVAGVTSQNGTTSDRLYGPFGLTLDFNNTLYIADYKNNRIQMFLAGASVGKTIAGNASGTPGSTASCFVYPSDVLIDTDGNIYVADMGNSRVMYWSNGATSGQKIAGFGGAPGSNTQLNQPYGITRDVNSNIVYIADSQNHRIMSYAFNATSGNVFAGGQGAGTNERQLNSPIAVYFDSLSNSLIIANSYTHDIVRWESSASSWTLVAGNINGSYGNTSTLLFYPYDVILDPMGNIYVADTANNRIQFFLTGQSDGLTIAGVTAVAGSSSTLLNSPYSLALDSQLNLYVSDTNNQRIQKFLRY